jgi:hypothetical protein
LAALSCGERHRSVGPPDGLDAPGWQSSYVSDCDGSDFDQSTGATPAVDRCANQLQDATIAVCWDQFTYTNPAMPGPWCTYKRLNGQTCNGGSNSGRVYTCWQP